MWESNQFSMEPQVTNTKPLINPPPSQTVNNLPDPAFSALPRGTNPTTLPSTSIVDWPSWARLHLETHLILQSLIFSDSSNSSPSCSNYIWLCTPQPNYVGSFYFISFYFIFTFVYFPFQFLNFCRHLAAQEQPFLYTRLHLCILNCSCFFSNPFTSVHYVITINVFLFILISFTISFNLNFFILI